MKKIYYLLFLAILAWFAYIYILPEFQKQTKNTIAPVEKQAVPRTQADGERVPVPEKNKGQMIEDARKEQLERLKKGETVRGEKTLRPDENSPTRLRKAPNAPDLNLDLEQLRKKRRSINVEKQGKE